MNTLPEEIQDTIYKYKHQMEFCKVVQELDTKGLCWWCGVRTTTVVRLGKHENMQNKGSLK